MVLITYLYSSKYNLVRESILFDGHDNLLDSTEMEGYRGVPTNEPVHFTPKFHFDLIFVPSNAPLAYLSAGVFDESGVKIFKK